MSDSGIYAILQLSSGRHYIGSAKSLDARWRKHLSDLRRNKHHCSKLQRSWNKYGEVDFRFDVIQRCGVDVLVEREQFFIDSTLPYFNVLRRARSPLGFKHANESIAKMKLPRLDLAGKRFGRLVAVEVSGRNSTGHYMWLCKCDCGNEKRVGASKLASGHTTSCGCLRKELAAVQGERYRNEQRMKQENANEL